MAAYIRNLVRGGLVTTILLTLTLGPMIVSMTFAQALAPTQILRGAFGSSNSNFAVNAWDSSWASVAWSYYQPRIDFTGGVNPATGLHRASLAWTCFTDWDLGSYIFANIYARKLGLIGDGTGSGDWQFLDRINKIMNFLLNRPLGKDNRPYKAYFWGNIPYKVCSDTGSDLTEAADSGRLLVALYALKTYNSNFAATVNAIEARSHSAYAGFASPTILKWDYYSYFVAEGYKAWGLCPFCDSQVFNVLDNYPNERTSIGSFVYVNGQYLPRVQTLAEPILHTILEADLLVHQPSPRFLELAARVNLAQGARYASTGELTAFTEGDYAPNPTYVYEWIIYPDKTPKQFVLGDGTYNKTYNGPPIAYTKVGFAYLAIYGGNTYISNLVNAVKPLATSKGFGEAVLGNGDSAITKWGSNTGGFYSDKTNELVLAAAAYHQSHLDAWDFSLSNSGDLPVNKGSSASNTITATLKSGTAQSITLTCTSGLPSGAQCVFPALLPNDGFPTFSSSLTITTSSSTSTGCYPITVTGTGGGISRTTYFMLIVTTNRIVSGVGGMGVFVTGACPRSVSFILPDYNGALHTPAKKCGTVVPAALSDYSAGGYVLGLLSNPQNQILDTSSSISQSSDNCGSPTGISGTIMTMAGPAVNEVINYYEASGTSPVYFKYANGNYNFAVRGTSSLYTLNPSPGVDLFVIEAFTDGLGHRVFSMYGFSWQGTLAAGQFFAWRMEPQLEQFPNSWYIYRWNDASSGNSHNSFPDPGEDDYVLVASSGPPPKLTSQTNTNTGTPYSGFAGIGNDVFQAPPGSDYFILPDYSAPLHTPAAKCGNVVPAQLSDYSAGGYLLSVLSNAQNEVLDTSSYVSQSTCGQFTGTTSVVVAVAGPAVNEVVRYYESGTSPVYFKYANGNYNLVVRATERLYPFNPSGGSDYFLLESFIDAQGRHVYIIYGLSWQGTLAAAAYLNGYILSHLSEFQKNWYIYRWSDASYGPSDNSFPDYPGGDSYIQIASG